MTKTAESAANNAAHLTETRCRGYTRVDGVEFAKCDSRGRWHRGYENVFDTGHRALFARCGVYGFAWLFTTDVRGRTPCRRCFTAPGTGALPAAGSGGPTTGDKT